MPLFDVLKSTKQMETKTSSAVSLQRVVERTQAVIEFKPDGTILSANQNFLDTLGYALEEIQGKHHSLFVDQAYAESDDYKEFWNKLASGEHFTDQFPRIAKGGSVVWIQATYAPVIAEDGQIEKVVKIATDITERQKGVQSIARALDHLSEGNLAYLLKELPLEDLDLLRTAFNRAQQQLAASIGVVKQVSLTAEHTANEIVQSSSELSKRTEQQAVALEQTAGAIEELTAALKSTATGAKEVEQAAFNAKSMAENGGNVVQETAQAMTLIETSSQKISQIVSVIDDITFQTNLLALNASVEAARAGTAGRGFSVVASEVRALAHRASNSAREINELISESSSHVTSGVGMVRRTGDELTNIIDAVAEISTSIASIAKGTHEQANTLNEINENVSQLDAVTQHNVAMVEESTAAGQSLADHANQLAKQVSFFTLPEEMGPNANDAQSEVPDDLTQDADARMAS